MEIGKRNSISRNSSNINLLEKHGCRTSHHPEYSKSFVKPLGVVDAVTMKRKRSRSETECSSNGTSGAQFDVFLSFRGPDTRATFTDSLYHALLDKGIHVFMNKKGIGVGEEIGSEILKLTQTREQNVPQLPQSLVSLCLSSIAIKKAPNITNLMSLRNLELCFTNSTSIEALLKVRTYSSCCMLELPNFISISLYWGRLCCLKELQLIDCYNLCSLGQLPSSLRKLEAHGCNLLEVVDLSNLVNLQLLLINACPKLVEIQGLDRLESLESLLIGQCNSLRRRPDLSNWKKQKRDW